MTVPQVGVAWTGGGSTRGEKGKDMGYVLEFLQSGDDLKDIDPIICNNMYTT